MIGCPDPAVAPDGLCIVCGGERLRTALKPLYAEAMRDDPFCTTECCRTYYRTTLPSKARVPRGYVSKVTGAG